VALNMSDVAKQRGYQLDREALERALAVPVIETVAIRAGGERALVEAIDRYEFAGHAQSEAPTPFAPGSAAEIEANQREVRRILDEIGYRVPARLALLSRLDAIVLNPVSGPILLAAVLFVMFQAVFSWAKVPQDLIQNGIASLSGWIGAHMHAGPLRS